MKSARTLPWDWYPGTIPENAIIDSTAYIESTYSFREYRSEATAGLRMGRGAAIYLGVMFDVGPRGRVRLGNCVLLNGARIICDDEIEIGDYTMIAWNAVLMDTYRVSCDPLERRSELERVSRRSTRHVDATVPARAVRIGRNVWIGFDVCVLPGVTIGEGSIVGARAVVTEDVAPFTIVGGNPARVIGRVHTNARRRQAPE